MFHEIRAFEKILESVIRRHRAPIYPLMLLHSDTRPDTFRDTPARFPGHGVTGSTILQAVTFVPCVGPLSILDFAQIRSAFKPETL